MPHDTQKKLPHFLLSLTLAILTVLSLPLHADLSTLAKNDALPVFTTLNQDDVFLLTKRQLIYKDYDWAAKKHDRFSLSISPFAQNADRGKTIRGSQPNMNITTPSGTVLVDTPLGDLTGRTGMIPLLYNNNNVWPQGQTNPMEALPPILFEAFDALFPNGVATDGYNGEGNIDATQRFGYFSFPLTYRKRGVRFELAALLGKGFGISLQTGVATIRQVREYTIDLTSTNPDFEPETTPSIDVGSVEAFLMDQILVIAQQIHLGFCDYIATSMEEVRFNLFWRQAFEMNKDAENDWAKFLIIPYIQGSGSVSPTKKDSDHQFFAAPFGNNTHASAGFTTGINLDFLETIEIGGEIGYTHFFSKNFCRPIPNNRFQTNIFPFSTEVKVSPGNNWHFGARIAAYHFIDNLSMYFEWFVLDHAQDDICLVNPDPAFLPGVLACTTSFKTKLGNAGFNYDLSPNVGVGFLWQIPFSQRNSYRSSTIMAGFNVTF